MNKCRTCLRSFETPGEARDHYESGVCETWRRTENIGGRKYIYWANPRGWTVQWRVLGLCIDHDYYTLPGAFSTLSEAKEAARQHYKETSRRTIRPPA